MEYTVKDSEGNAVTQVADNWMVAAALVLERLDVDVNALGSLTCEPRADGSVMLTEQRSGLWWSVHEPVPERSTPAPAPRVMASARSVLLEDTEQEWDDEPSVTFYVDEPPALSMPTSSLQKVDLESLAERLFDLSMDIVSAEPSDAARLALSVLEEFVGAEVTSVVRGTLDDTELVYVAARGRVADRIRGRRIPFGEGLVGDCFDRREILLVQDVRADPRFSRRLDEATGFVTVASLCVPVLDEAGAVYGVIQVLNPTAGTFSDEDVEAVESIARTLAGPFAS